ncbi:TRAP transporter small permease [Thermodesulfobacteriota bacterium]
MKTAIERTQKILHRLEDGILVGLLLLVIGVAVTQIVLRNLFEGGIVWGDVLVRVLVLWIGLFGAMVASRKGNHICIDAVTRYLPKRVKGIINCVAALFTAVVCSVMVYYSLLFVWMEFEGGAIAFARVPTWVCEAVIPFAFAVIALRYFVLMLISFTETVKTPS